MKIAVDPGIRGGFAAFEHLGDAVPLPVGGLDGADLSDVEALIVRSVDRVDASVLVRAPRLSFVGSATAGIDHVDTEALRAGGVEFAHAPGCNARAVVEWVIAALASTEPALVGLPTAADPRASVRFGVVGCGAVGSELVRTLEALDRVVLRCDPPRQRRGDPGPWHGLGELFERCDVISLHVPLTVDGPHATARLVSAEVVSRALESGTTVVNASRGAVLELPPGVAGGQLILDVWPDEPSVDPAYVNLAALASPHVAGYSERAKASATAAMVQAVALHLGQSSGPVPGVTTVERVLDGEVGSFLAELGGLRRDDAAMRSLAGAAAFRRLRSAHPLRPQWCDVRVRGGTPDQRHWLVRAGFRQFAP